MKVMMTVMVELIKNNQEEKKNEIKKKIFHFDFDFGSRTCVHTYTCTHTRMHMHIHAHERMKYQQVLKDNYCI